MKRNAKLIDDLYPIINETWATLKKSCLGYARKDPYIEFDEDGFNRFREQFESLYASILKKYMVSSVTELDRHKLAAIMIISSINAETISYRLDKIPPKTIFIGGEMIAVEVALSWMIEGLNSALKEKGVRVKIDKYVMPTAFACSTPYFEIFCRNLLYAQKDYVLNPLDISDKLFLLEYITLLENHIDPTILKHTS